jgi:hypothetical protein
MGALTYPAISVASFGACGYRLVAFKGRPIAITAAFADLGLTFAVSTPVLATRIDDASGVHQLAVMIGQALALVFSLCVLTTVLEWTSAPRRRIVGWWMFGAIGIATMTTLFLTCPALVESATFNPADAASWQFSCYLVVYCVAFGACQTATSRLCLLMAAAGGPPWPRRGLRATAAGAVTGLLYCAIRLMDAAPSSWGIPLVPEAAARVLIAVGVALPLIGWQLPSWGPEAVDRRQTLADRRSTRRLRALWSDIAAAVPQVILTEEPTEMRAPQRAAFRCTRRQAEIWDGYRLLRPHLDRTLPPQPAAAAGWFAEALAAHRLSTDPPQAPDSSAVREAPQAVASMDADWLCRVADEYRKVHR